MNDTVSISFKYEKRARRRRIYLRILSVLMCVTVFCTVYMLMLPALTMEADEAAVCGLISHTHGEECYENGVLVCSIPEHEHDMECFSDMLWLYKYSCGYEYEHTHSEECYIGDALVCSLTEHVHGENCEKIENPIQTKLRKTKLLAEPDIASGYYGSSQNIKWVINAAGELTITNNIGSHSIQSIPGSDRPWDAYKTQITKVTIGPYMKLEGNAGISLFSGYTACKEFDLHNLDTSSATYTRTMFSNCTSAESINMSGWNTSRVVDMQMMFSSCSSLESLDLSGFNTSRVMYMNSMFSGCNALEQIVFSSDFTTGNVTNMSSMFSSCKALTEIDVSGFNTSKVTNMGLMFNYCSALTELDVSNFDTSKVTNMYNMFNYCSALTELDLSAFNTVNVTNMSNMFSGCYALEKIVFSSDFTTGNVTNMASMFSNCYALYDFDISSFNTSNVTNMGSMFNGCSAITELDLSNFDTSSVTDMGSGNSYGGTTGMFSRCSSLKSLDLSSFNTSNVTTMVSMFRGCNSLEAIDVSGFDVSSVTNMEQMFYGCGALAELDLSEWNTSSDANMNGMFVAVGGNHENGTEIILGESFTVNTTAQKTPFIYTDRTGTATPNYYIKLNADGTFDTSVKDNDEIAAYQLTSTSDTVYVPYYSICFNANGGTFADGTTEKEIYYRAGNYWSLDDAPAVHNSSYSLIGWDSTVNNPSTRINGNEWRLSDRFGQYSGTHDYPAVRLYAEWASRTVSLDTSDTPIAAAISTGDNNGEDIPEKTFTFTVNCTEPLGPAPAVGTVDTDGAGTYIVDFGELEFNYPGTYHLEIIPTDESAGGWIINRIPKTVIVTVTEDGEDGPLSISAVTPVEFINIYSWGKSSDLIGEEDKSDPIQKNYTVQEAKDILLKSSEWTDKNSGEGEIRLIYNNTSADKNESRAVYLLCTCLAHDFTIEIAESNINFLRQNFTYVDVISLEDQMHAGGFAKHCASFTSSSTDADVESFLGTIKFLQGNHAGVMYTIDIMTEYLSHFEPTAVYVSFDGVRGFGTDGEPYSFADSIYLEVLGNDYLTEEISYTDEQMATIRKLANYQKDGLYYLMSADKDGRSSNPNDTHNYIYTKLMPFKYAEDDDGERNETAYRNLLYHFFATVSPAVFLDAPDDVEDMIDSLMTGEDYIVWKDMLASYSETYGDRVYSYDQSFESLGIDIPVGRQFVVNDTIDKDFSITETAALDGVKVGFYGVDDDGNVTWTDMDADSYTLTQTTDTDGNTVISVSLTVENLTVPLAIRIPIKTELEQYKTDDNAFRSTNIDDAYVDVTVEFENTKTQEISESTSTTTSTDTPKLFKKISVIDFYIEKFDENWTHLQGVRFALYAANAANAPDGAETYTWNGKTYYKVAEKETDANGIAKFDDLKTGSVYLFREVMPLAGFSPMSGCQEFFFAEAEYGEECVYRSESDAEEGDNYYLSADELVPEVVNNPDEMNVFFVINYPYSGEELPSTGGNGTTGFVIAACLIFALGIVGAYAYLCVERRRRGSER